MENRRKKLRISVTLCCALFIIFFSFQKLIKFCIDIKQRRYELINEKNALNEENEV